METKPIVAVAGFKSTDDSFVDNLMYAIKSNIEFTLKLMGKYSVKECNEIIVYDDFNAIKSYCLASNVDNLIVGNVIKTGDKIYITMCVYDRLMDTVTVEKEAVIEELFDIFDAGDRLVIELIEGFSGIHVGYGKLEFINHGVKGDYTLFIDEEPAGESLSVLENVFIGSHRIKIVQNRLKGEYVILDEDIVVLEDSSVQVEITVPYTTEEEREMLLKIDSMVLENWNNPEMKDEITGKLNNLCAIYDSTSYCEGLFELKQKYEQLLKEYSSIIIEGDGRTKEINRLDEEEMELLELQRGTVFSHVDGQFFTEYRIAGEEEGIDRYISLLGKNIIMVDIGPLNQQVEPDWTGWVNSKEPPSTDDWIPNPQNGHYYRLTPEMTWNEAEELSVSWGGHLVTINNRKENEWLVGQFGNGRFFIGFNDMEIEGDWKWVSGDKTEYTNWYPGQPYDSVNEDVAEFTWNYGEPVLAGYWNDIDRWRARIRGIVEWSSHETEKPLNAPFDTGFTVTINPDLEWEQSSDVVETDKYAGVLQDGLKTESSDVVLTFKGLTEGNYTLSLLSLNPESDEPSAVFDIILQDAEYKKGEIILSEQHIVSRSATEQAETFSIDFVSDGEDYITVTLKRKNGELWLNGFILTKMP